MQILQDAFNNPSQVLLDYEPWDKKDEKDRQIKADLKEIKKLINPEKPDQGSFNSPDYSLQTI